MSDLISREAVLESLKTDNSLIMFDGYGNLTFTGERIIEAIKRVPSVEPERPKGKWIKVVNPDTNDWTGGFKCSECDSACVQMSMDYCANCGADMRVEQALKYADNDTAKSGLQSAT